ncbi:MAG: hypothetical protein CMD14_05490 [Flavobacteriales bacterium]|nr:hypothetical protein [Flavobacteriales bacterium]|tara:strand:- start:34920 stop:36971 length:2052 start_codon:yes stop_codon:yes gene_type:complete
MKKLFLILICFPFIGFGQLSVGVDQDICFGDEAQIIATLSGPGTVGCSGATDSLASDIGSSNGSAGTMFNIVNTSANDVTITGFSQGTYSYSGTNVMDIWYYPGDYIPVMSSTNGWTQVAASVSVNIPSGASTTTPLYSSIIPITSVIIPAGATYGFYVGGSSTVSYSTATAGTIPGVSPWGSNSLLTITVGHGGNFPSPVNNPRGPLIKVYYGGGATWYDVNSGQLIGGGDTLVYTPSQSTDIAAVFDCNGNTYADTMHVEVVNTNISSTGTSLCNGPLVLSAPSGFLAYNWNGPSTNNLLTVNSPGDYYVSSTTNNGLTCHSDTITVYSGNIPINLSTSDSVFICQGDTVLIDGPLGFSSYNWSTGATSSSISTTSVGNYSLSVIDINGCTGTSNTTTVSISPTTITASASGLSLCNGNVTLDAGSGFIDYQWYNNGSMMINTAQTLIVSNAGNYHVDVTYPTGCTATSNIIQIISGASQFYCTIDSIGNGSLCLPNGQVILDAGNYATYNWSTGDTTQQITVNAIGSYSVNVTDVNGCQGVSDAPFIVSNIVNTSAISGPTSPTVLQPVNYSVVATPGSTYDWTLVGGSMSGQGTNSIDVTWNSSGMFSFFTKEIDINGCVGEQVSLLVNVIVSSIEEENRNKKLLMLTDIFGKEVNYRKNTPLFYIYDDKTVEKRIVVE